MNSRSTADSTARLALTAAHTRPVRLSPLDILGLGLLGIRTRTMRAALSALGISIGIATMIVVTGIPSSSRQALMNQLTALGTNMLQVQPEPDQKPPVLLSSESVDMAARIGPVTVASAVANTHSKVHRSDRVDPDDYAGLTVLASRLDLLPALNASVRSGSFLTPATGKFPAAVLGSVAATRLGIESVRPGQPSPQIFINDRWFTVVGILARTPLSPDIDRSVLVGWDAARAQLHFDGHPTVIYVKARENAIEAVRAVLPATVHPQLPGMVRVSRPSDALAAKRATESNFSALFLGLAGVALLVGGIGVANTMVISVLERRREIGLRRALGAHRGQIRNQFLTESVILSALGGLAGVVLGVLATVGYVTYQHWPVVIPIASVTQGFGGALLVGVMAGVYPSIRASRLTPNEALASA
ncbi:ABC transporter permease [Streptomyces sp. NBC_00322]|uniref:ABC transporter permease n=1 Tax=Streptomyces sp. NBC_00322 TaxID=2975712 RepID=UPI002E2E4EA6|nr:ABC transporter permease [Streptomyces sp. NBC_00322]